MHRDTSDKAFNLHHKGARLLTNVNNSEHDNNIIINPLNNQRHTTYNNSANISPEDDIDVSLPTISLVRILGSRMSLSIFSLRVGIGTDKYMKGSNVTDCRDHHHH